MLFRGRTVVAFVLLAMFATCLVTLMMIDHPIFAMDDTRSVAAPVEPGGMTDEEIDKINAAYSLIEKNYVSPLERQKVLDGAIKGMIDALGDPYSSYLDKEMAQHFAENIQGSFIGIGAEVEMKNGKVTVTAPIKGSPAEKAGIHPGDIILSVNGVKLEGMTGSDAVAKIRGPKGTKAKLVVRREGVADPIEIVVVRDTVDVETVNAEMLESGIGKIEIIQFSQNTGERFKEELEALEAKGMKGLIIDVRNDPGGILPVVKGIAELFVPKGKALYQVEGQGNKIKSVPSEGSSKPYPVTVLIDKGSASAAEILAAAIQQSAGGKLIGETSFGKGTVQMNFSREMGDGSMIKLTIAKWLTPNGSWIHEKGIVPDMAVQQPEYFKVFRIATKDTKLKLEMNNNDVKSAQIMLQGLGFDPGRKDGYFNEQTQRVVKEFQQKAQLPVTGEIDQATVVKLEEAIVEEMRKPSNDAQLAAAIQYLKGAIKQS